MDYEALIPLISQPGTIVWLSSLNLYWYFLTKVDMYIYMQDKLYYYAVWWSFEWNSNKAWSQQVYSNVNFKIYDVLPWDTVDWVMTSNGIYQKVVWISLWWADKYLVHLTVNSVIPLSSMLFKRQWNSLERNSQHMEERIIFFRVDLQEVNNM